MMTLAAIVLLGVLSHVLGASLQFRPIDDTAAVCNDGSKAGLLIGGESLPSIVCNPISWQVLHKDVFDQ